MFSTFNQLCNMFSTISPSKFTFVTSLTADLLPDMSTNNHQSGRYTTKNQSTNNTHQLDTLQNHTTPQLVARATSLTT